MTLGTAFHVYVCVPTYKYALFIFGCMIAHVFYIIVLIPYNDNEHDEVESSFTLYKEMLLFKPKYF